MSGPTRIRAGLTDATTEVDLVVIGLGVTGTGVALDAVTRGLDVLAVDAHDLAFGTSRWSSKMVHGGLRYLAQGQVGVAHESAVERGILMETTAPHLARAMPMLIPITSGTAPLQRVLSRSGLVAGDLLRRGAGTDVETLPRPRHLSRTEALAMAPGLRPAGLRGALLGWDGQLEDDARLVTTIARTAAAYGAEVRTRARVLHASGTEVTLRDEITGATSTVRARAVVNATGVWAGDLADEVTLRPSRGTHLVLRGDRLPGLRTSVFAPVPGSTSRFVMVLPQPDGTIYVGLTDEPAPGPVPDVPQPTEPEIGFLLDVVAATFTGPLRREDVVGAFAGLRPLLDRGRLRGGRLDGGPLATPRRADRAHRDGHGRRRQAHDLPADGAGRGRRRGRPRRSRRRPVHHRHPAAARGRAPGPCSTLWRSPDGSCGASAPTPRWCSPRPARSPACSDEELLAPAAPTVPVTLAELVFAVTHEGAHDVDDLLDRRTRVGLVAADRALAGAARRARPRAGAARSGERVAAPAMSPGPWSGPSLDDPLEEHP